MSESKRNRGHGHVHPRPDGVRARCGGPTICSDCAVELAAVTGKPELAKTFNVVTHDACQDRIAELEAENARLLEYSKVRRLNALETALAEAYEMIQHAVAMGNFTPGGSTEGWANHVLAAIRRAKGEKTEGA